MTTERTLDENKMNQDPLIQFTQWYDEAVAASQPYADAMVLATATTAGVPSARVVLLKGVDPRGLLFFTNYQSRKGRELSANQKVGLVFWWHLLERQVRIDGSVEKVSAAESDAYFTTRPRESQIGAHASRQSENLRSREELETAAAAIEAMYAQGEIPRPGHWGGYRVIPSVIEFWQGRPGRLHDRIRYSWTKTGLWKIDRLAP
jgi:pyridoxamine 5'-phosphate oxidase